MNFELIPEGLRIMAYGMGTTFTILILFYFMIKGLLKFFPYTEE
ncbi:Na+-transporting methylmalonyl-CoA/oxaloacetate decarboxylase gamma subunit [Anaerosolibacter carboniphilus]|uniref:Na+-transporting methylmalonyl-CoA/oxaloacetate decarboxylase gamma subunit n=1 Tax=Anaerosolibacter carboniphilus TaxID=1417629 RepID=A0A841KYA2_9FIRM|nr:OadG family protein [Anaerosolibacter carboniphilus]MBB6215892.1 Na+-transporting methylmalonyl-CoA/oxaloacetate decarboxylase gamma subunit [Anaerosolibacter carboniphilus]